ncbi:GMP synthase [glutamine-hydrolyzing] subunit A [uncultured archaeon]|nr:GMP synthase [glutamine-hydrolyzing] subunit A [uncultured archaeon]
MKIAILNLGSQYTHVIWRTCRDLGVEAVIHQPDAAADVVDFFDAFIFSGGPASAPDMKPNQCHRLLKASALADPALAQAAGLAGASGPGASASAASKPILGICMGHQLMGHVLGGTVGKGPSAEYGVSEILVDEAAGPLAGMPPKFQAWVSHFDEVKKVPAGFRALAHSDTCAVEAMMHEKLPLWGVQFHPEVWHTQNGEKILENFCQMVKK